MDRDEIEAEVRTRRQTPAWAERQVAARGEEPFAPIQRPWSYWEGTGKWPINLAVLWLACASPEDAATHWNRLRFWGRHVWRDVEDWHRPQHDLAEALRCGRLVAWAATDRMGDFIAIPQDCWEEGLFWETDRDFTVAVMPDGEVRWKDIRVARADVVKLWPKTRTAIVQVPQQKIAEDPASRQARINSVAAGLPPGLILDPRKKDDVARRSFRVAIKAVCGPVTRKEARAAWNTAYPHWRRGRPPNGI